MSPWPLCRVASSPWWGLGPSPPQPMFHGCRVLMIPCLLLKAAGPPGAGLLSTSGAGSGCVAAGAVGACRAAGPDGPPPAAPRCRLLATGEVHPCPASGAAAEMGRLQQRGLRLAGVFCACPALPEKGSLRARPPAQITLIPGRSGASPAIISAHSFVSGGRTSNTDFSEEAATCQAPVTRLTRPCPRGWVGLSVQMTLRHLSCSVLGCTHWGLEATHTYCPTVLEAGAWNQGVRAVSCWRLSGRNPLPPPAPGAPGILGLWPLHSLFL